MAFEALSYTWGGKGGAGIEIVLEKDPNLLEFSPSRQNSVSSSWLSLATFTKLYGRYAGRKSRESYGLMRFVSTRMTGPSEANKSVSWGPSTAMLGEWWCGVGSVQTGASVGGSSSIPLPKACPAPSVEYATW